MNDYSELSSNSAKMEKMEKVSERCSLEPAIERLIRWILDKNSEAIVIIQQESPLANALNWMYISNY